MKSGEFILKVSCEDQKGLIYQISKLIFEANLNIDQQSEFVNKNNQQFYFRADFSGKANIQKLTEQLKKVLPANAKISIKSKAKLPIVILSGKEGHCLGDLLLKQYNNDANYEIQAVISNHPCQQTLTEKFDIPFHLISTDKDKASNEESLKAIFKTYQFETIVLCKYMQILSEDFVNSYPNQIINIHHSFLPAFIGAKPYHQAYERGVKIIGATAHYVTSALDAGPIIYQDIARVTHKDQPADMIRIGKNLESSALAEGLRLHADNRIFITNNRTIIL